MTFRKTATAIIALAASSAPAFAQEVSRAATSAADTSQFGGDSTLLLILAIALIAAGILVLAGNNSDTPTSP